MTDAADGLRALMRAAPQLVTVVTAWGPEGPRGITVSSFIPVSLAPPTVLVSIMKSARAHAAIAAGRFRVHLLAEDQAAVSAHFARPGLGSDEQFGGGFRDALEGRRAGEPPRLPDCLGWAECETISAVDSEDHTLFLGRVREASVGREEALPLLYVSRGYRRVGEALS